MPHEELDAAFLGASVQRVGRQEAVFSEGEKLAHFYNVRSGSFKLVRHSVEGKELIVSLVGPGDYFGALSAPEESTCLAQALEDSEIAVIPSTALRRALASHAELALHLLAYAERRLIAAEAAAASLAFEPVPRRLARFLLEKSDVSTGRLRFPLNQAEIANLIGSSRETVCSALNRLRRQGILRMERGRIRVLDRDRLEP